MSARGAALGLLLAVAGCECGVPGPGDGGADGGPVPAGTTAFTATRRGGFAVPQCPLDGGTTPDTFHLVLDGGAFEAAVCKRPQLQVVRLSRTLSAQELQGVRAALQALGPASGGCGADKPELRVRVDTPAGALTLVDDFYACSREPGVVYVDGMDPLFGTLDLLVP